MSDPETGKSLSEGKGRVSLQYGLTTEEKLSTDMYIYICKCRLTTQA